MSNRVKGIISILFASMGFAFMSIFVKMSGDLPTVQKVIFRNLISMIIAFIMITIHKKRYIGKKRKQKDTIIEKSFRYFGNVIIFLFYI